MNPFIHLQPERIAESGAEKIEEFEDISCSYKNLGSNNVVQAIENEIKEVNAKLLIMIPQKHGFWESMIHRSKTRIMASDLSIPLLSIPE